MPWSRLPRFVLAAVVLIVVATLVPASARPLSVGGPAPELAGTPWIGSAPLTTAGLCGRVVLVEFWTYGARILIVDDEPEIVRGLADNLKFEGHDTVSAATGAEALAAVEREALDLVILDIMMPAMSGWDVAKDLRRRGIDVPIIMLTARGEEVDRVLGLELGADDYVTKPFSLRELLARVRAVLRRPGPRHKAEDLAFDDVRIQRRARRVFKAGAELRLTRKEFDLLVYLVEHRGEVLTPERLLDEVWGYERFPTTRTVDTHVRRLRRKLEADPDRPAWIQTVHAQGYRFATV